MRENKTKKELKLQYKERTITGGVFAIRNTVNNRLLLDATTDLQGSKNRFDFTKMTGSGLHLKIQKDWTAQKGEGFVFEVLEELEKDPVQTQQEFEADIQVLKELWGEKLAGENLY